MGGLSNVHMPSSARDGTLAINRPPESRAAKERKETDLFMLFELLICHLCRTQNGGFLFFSQLVFLPAKGSPRTNTSSPGGDTPGITFAREEQPPFLTPAPFGASGWCLGARPAK